MKLISAMELEAQRAVLLRQLRRAGPMVEGSLARVARRCGSANCPCRQGGKKHEALILCKKVKGRSVATYVPKDLQEQVRTWNQEHQRIKRVMKQISDLNERMIRQHVRQMREARRAPLTLKVGGKSSLP
jgi:hypothetical protein